MLNLESQTLQIDSIFPESTQKNLLSILPFPSLNELLEIINKDQFYQHSQKIIQFYRLRDYTFHEELQNIINPPKELTKRKVMSIRKKFTLKIHGRLTLYKARILTIAEYAKLLSIRDQLKNQHQSLYFDIKTKTIFYIVNDSDANKIKQDLIDYIEKLPLDKIIKKRAKNIIRWNATKADNNFQEIISLAQKVKNNIDCFLKKKNKYLRLVEKLDIEITANTLIDHYLETLSQKIKNE